MLEISIAKEMKQMRLIDADALYLRMAGHGWWNNTDRDIVLDVLERMPTIDPKPKWIPVGERLPEDDTMMLVTYRTNRGLLRINQAYYNRECWRMNGYNVCGVIAWMPLPKPYDPDDVERVGAENETD